MSTAGDDAAKKLYAFTIQQMKAGADGPTIAQRLVDLGVPVDQAAPFIDSACEQILQVARDQQPSLGSVLRAASGAALAAVIGGAIWGGIVIVTKYEIGYMATAIGALVGYAVVLSSGGKKGLPLQVTAVAASLFGIAVGKYVTFYYFLKSGVREEHGSAAADQVSLLSANVLAFFINNVSATLNPFDLLWVILAVSIAWRIPRGLGIKPPSVPQPR